MAPRLTKPMPDARIHLQFSRMASRSPRIGSPELMIEVEFMWTLLSLLVHSRGNRYIRFFFLSHGCQRAPCPRERESMSLLLSKASRFNHMPRRWVVSSCEGASDSPPLHVDAFPQPRFLVISRQFSPGRNFSRLRWAIQ